jgi:hypothetical protein
MNVASVTVRAISHGLYFGFQGASIVSVTLFFLILCVAQASVRGFPNNLGLRAQPGHTNETPQTEQAAEKLKALSF